MTFNLFSRPARAVFVTASLLACAGALPVAAQTATPTPPAAAQAPESPSRPAPDSPEARPEAAGEDAPRPGQMEPYAGMSHHGKHHGDRSRGAEVKVDFGGGRKLHLSCGDTPVEACLRAAQPLVEMVADAEPVPHPHAMPDHKGPKGPKGPKPEDRGPEAPRP